MERLSNLVTDLLIEQDAHFKSLALILSKPIALLVFKSGVVQEHRILILLRPQTLFPGQEWDLL